MRDQIENQQEKVAIISDHVIIRGPAVLLICPEEKL
jgi:hypothetical protein